MSVIHTESSLAIPYVYRRPLIYTPVSLLRVEYQELAAVDNRLQVPRRWFKHQSRTRVICHWLPGQQKRFSYDSIFVVHIHSPNLSYRIRTYSRAHRKSHTQVTRMYCSPSSEEALSYSRFLLRREKQQLAFLETLKILPHELRRQEWLNYVLQSHGDLLKMHSVNTFGHMRCVWYYTPHYPSKTLIKKIFAYDVF